MACKITLNLILYGSIILIVVIAVCLTVQFAPSINSSNKSRLSLTSNSAEPNMAIIMPPMCRLFWDKTEGAFMITLKIGAGLVDLVVDTGSNVLSAKAKQCEFNECNGSECNLKTCPCGDNPNGTPRLDCSTYAYQPSESSQILKPGEHGAGYSTRLQYGSQEDSIVHYVDSVEVPYIDVKCADVLSAEYRHFPATDRFINLGSDVIVHSVYHIKGASSSNLFGLARPGGGDRVLLESLFSKKSKIHFSMILRKQFGYYATGPMPCFNKVNYMKLQQPTEFMSFMTKFYIVKLTDMYVGSDPNNLSRVTASVPKFVIIDTGTTCSYTSPSLGSELQRMGYSENGDCIQLHLGSRRSPLIITYSPSDMRDPETGGSSFNCLSGNTLDNFDKLFPLSPPLLLGALMMQNMYWEIDLSKNRVGVQLL